MNDRVGIVIPAYKEADNIASLIQEILKHVPSAAIVVVDDSPDLATEQAASRPGLGQVTVIHRGRKGGRGSAVLEGVVRLLQQGCTQILEMDADFSHPPSQIPSLLKEAVDRRLGLLVASRYLPQSHIQNWPLSRRLFSRCSNMLARAALGVPIADYTNGFRVYSRPAAETIVVTCGKEGRGFIALSEILVNLHYRGYTIGETPTIFVNRARGESSVNYQEVRDALTGLIRIFLLRRRLVRGGVAARETVPDMRDPSTL
jgi:dolichol-phosphate mannosyltransferase